MKILLATRGRMFYDLQKLVADTIEILGHIPKTINDVSDNVGDVDCILIMGDANWLHTKGLTIEFFERFDCPIVYWHFEPMPFPGISSRAQRMGRRLANCQWDKLLGGQLKKFRSLLSMRLIRRMASFGLRSELAANGWPSAQLMHIDQLYEQFAQQLWVDNTKESFVAVFSDSMPRVLDFRDLGIPASFEPIPYGEAWGTDRGEVRDLDVVFLGSLYRTKRKRLLERVRATLSHSGFALSVVDKDCYGPQRNDLLNRAKIVLDIVKYPTELQSFRMLMSTCCGALLVSNCPGDSQPYIAGEHFVRTTDEALPGSLLEYLRDAEARQAIVRNAQAFVRYKLSVQSTVRRLFSAVIEK